MEKLSRILTACELPALIAVPTTLAACALFNLRNSALFTLLVTLLGIAFMLASFEASRPALRQLMPTAVLGAMAAAGRILFAPFPDVKPVSAIAIVAGATLGRRCGFVVGALAALISNAFFGQGVWTAWQMYSWGLVGYLGGVLGERGLLEKPLLRSSFAFAAGPLYGLLLNSWHILGFVRPLTWQAALLAYGAALHLDLIHGAATVAFLAIIWTPWRRSIVRVVEKYELAR